MADLQCGPSIVLTKGVVRMLFPFLVVFFLFSESDRLHTKRVRREAVLLQERCMSIADAAPSSAEDKKAILNEVAGKEDAVNMSISVLLDAGMSTCSLRDAVSRGVSVEGAGEMRRALGWMGFSLWCLVSVYVCCHLGADEPHLYHPGHFLFHALAIMLYA